MWRNRSPQNNAPVDGLPLHSAQTLDQAQRQPSWRASLAVRGMTCGSCANTITHNLEQNSGWKVNVNLLANEATVEYHGAEEDVSRVVGAIQDLGYEAVLDQVVRVDETCVDEPSDRSRTVEIRVDGFRCGFCPARVIGALESCPQGDVDVLTEPTLAQPIVKIRYTPDAPRFTVRHILAAIKRADEKFAVHLYKPPSLEERSKHVAARHQRDLLNRLILTAIITIPTFVVGIIYMTSVPEDDPGRIWLMEPWRVGIGRAQFFLLALSTPVFFWPAAIFHKRAIKGIVVMWRRSSETPLLQRFYRFGSMDLLVSLGTGVAYFSSCAQMIVAAVDRPKHVDESSFYFDTVVFLTLFLLLGKLIESYSKSRAGDAVESLVKLRPTIAVLVDPGDGAQTRDTIVPVDHLEINDRVRIPHGASPPCDGMIAQGETKFDESSLTGESRLIKKSLGDPVYSGTVNKDSPILVQITGIAGHSMLDKIVRIVREGQTNRAPVEKIADRLTAYFVPIITLIAIITWVVWLVLGLTGAVPGHFLDGESSGSWVAFSLRFAIAVFVVACPCGLALAAPTAIFVGGGLAAKHGILVKGGGEAFEKASHVDCVVFDKTGTLTMGGEPKVTDSILAFDHARVLAGQRDTFLAALQAIEEGSSHPIAKAIVSFCNSQTDRSSQVQVSVSNVAELPGKGLKATAAYTSNETPDVPQGIVIAVGNEALMADLKVVIPTDVVTTLQTWKSEAKSIALVAIQTNNPDNDGSPCDSGSTLISKTDSATTISSSPAPNDWTIAAAFSIADPVRPEAPAVVRTLRESSIDVWMLSGDNITTARAVASQIGIPESNVIAGVLPTEKHERIAWLQSTLKVASRHQHRARTESRTHPLWPRVFGHCGKAKSPEQELEEGERGGRNGERQLGEKAGRTNNADGDITRHGTGRRATIAMVGDGINDAAALNTADVGVAVGSGSDVAIASAGFVLISDNLGTMVTLLDLSRAVLRRIKFNFTWAVVYNLIAVPVAAGCFYPIVVKGGAAGANRDGGGAEVGMGEETRVRLEPEWAALAMAASSISVVLSSLALRSRWWAIGFKARKAGGQAP
ncbi:hypothetical protein DL764_000023 [Monosporascus ibericus]|uniref:HMA domain-containing protein n=1 Tax=Monosporascus ibericus TaxID=155417 RepID=A0A4Q4U0M3_9PEZI|nr:hypothetical protein DL764_000023 [Monosporascus ibericus]